MNKKHWFAPDLYPRQRTGLVLVLLFVPLMLWVLTTTAYLPLVVMFTLKAGIGLGMMSGNTRTRRVPYSYDRKLKESP